MPSSSETATVAQTRRSRTADHRIDVAATMAIAIETVNSTGSYPSRPGIRIAASPRYWVRARPRPAISPAPISGPDSSPLNPTTSSPAVIVITATSRLRIVTGRL